MLGGEEGAGEVDVERRQPHGALEAVGAVVGADELDRGVGHHDVEAAEARGGVVEGRTHCVLVADVRVQRERAVAQRRGRLVHASVVDVDERDARPLAGEALGDGTPDPAGGSGDDGALGLEAPHRGPTVTARRTPLASVRTAGVQSPISTVAPPGSASTPRPKRLGRLRRELGQIGTLSISIGVMAPTLAMSITGVAAAGLLGRAASLAYVVAAIGVGLVAYGFARLSAEFSSAGSVYAFVGGALGPRAGFVAGWALLGTYLIFPVVSISAIAIFGQAFLRTTGIAHDARVAATGARRLGARVAHRLARDPHRGAHAAHLRARVGGA